MVDYHEKRRIYVIPITVDLKNELANYMHGNRVFAQLLVIGWRRMIERNPAFHRSLK